MDKPGTPVIKRRGKIFDDRSRYRDGPKTIYSSGLLLLTSTELLE